MEAVAEPLKHDSRLLKPATGLQPQGDELADKTPQDKDLHSHQSNSAATMELLCHTGPESPDVSIGEKQGKN